MHIYVNNQQHDLPESSSVAAMLRHIEVASGKGIAVAINNNVIPRTEWDTHEVQANDKITLIKATQGG